MTKNNDLPDEILVAWSGGSLSTMTVFTEIFDEKLKSRAVEYVRKDLSPPVPDDVADCLDKILGVLGVDDLNINSRGLLEGYIRAASTPSAEVRALQKIPLSASTSGDFIAPDYIKGWNAAIEALNQPHTGGNAMIKKHGRSK